MVFSPLQFAAHPQTIFVGRAATECELFHTGKFFEPAALREGSESPAGGVTLLFVDPGRVIPEAPPTTGVALRHRAARDRDRRSYRRTFARENWAPIAARLVRLGALHLPRQQPRDLLQKVGRWLCTSGFRRMHDVPRPPRLRSFPECRPHGRAQYV